MRARRLARRARGVLLFALLVAGCGAQTRYRPQVLARGELVLGYDDRFEMWAGGQKIAQAPYYGGLPGYVRCVPEAYSHAVQARSHGRGAVALATLGGILGVAGIGGLYGLHDQQHLWEWMGAGLASATVGVVLASASRKLRNSSNGHAVDALNLYNDSVGSLGASCDDLRYPPPSGPLPDATPPAPAGEPSEHLPPAEPLTR